MIAVVPMPLAPPWMRMVSPACSRPRSKTFVQTVKNVSGMAAASTMLNPRGTGRHCTAGAAQYSAYPPPATSAQTRSPGAQPRDRRRRSPTIVPATSRPGVSGAPGGGGYFPCRCSRSGRFTPAAATRISTSPPRPRAPGAARGLQDLGTARRGDRDGGHRRRARPGSLVVPPDRGDQVFARTRGGSHRRA